MKLTNEQFLDLPVGTRMRCVETKEGFGREGEIVTRALGNSDCPVSIRFDYTERPRHDYDYFHNEWLELLEDQQLTQELTAQSLVDLPDNTPVRVLIGYEEFDEGDIIYRLHSEHLDDTASCRFSSRPHGKGFLNFMTYEEVEVIVESPVMAAMSEATGIARPVLEERKIGKIAIELFDDGFPNAVMAVAEVMTWAAEHKGYKPHDWRALPNAEIAFAAAGSRHRIKHIIQRAEGASIAECVDEESALLHKAHEAFNVLAQLELMVTNRI